MELIYKNKLLEAIDDCDYCDHCSLSICLCICDNFRTEKAIVNLIKDTPAVDAVEVVRCKECKHWLKDIAGCTENVGRCEWANWMVGENGYCVYGERKDEKTANEDS